MAKTFTVESIALTVPQEKAFTYLADPRNLPAWTNAFKTVGNGAARLETPSGAVEVRLETKANREAGCVDWKMTFPGGQSPWRTRA